MLKQVRSANLPKIEELLKEFPNVEMKMIFEMVIKMTALTSLDLSGKHHYVFNNFIFGKISKVTYLFFKNN